MDNYILIAEDDPQQAETIRQSIEEKFPGLVVREVETESEFYKELESTGAEKRPRLVICDTMLSWSYPDPDAPDAPPEVKSGTFRKAGVRCWKKFREKQQLRRVPWIYYTVLDKQTIEFQKNSDGQTAYVQKTNSVEPLMGQIGEWLRDGGESEVGSGGATANTGDLASMLSTLMGGLRAASQAQSC